MEIYLTKSPAQTKKLGQSLAKRILKSKTYGKSTVLGLVGDLGGGKTTFLQGFAKGLEIKERVLSPTFVLMKKFSTSRRSFIHIDCYRIKKAGELLDLGFKEFVSDPRNIIAVEWSDRVKKIMPKNAILLRFEFINKNTRKIVIESKNGKRT
ncbi:MAG TPA: tRNA (adenosine(37)-N6)-threonylcarbamoyltransferase complex ATPase subunit type 1 TsaE [Candidatus Paceibacterota bacterium]|nr:tRNA (adenosine(37)-N6)-threonylcarbamoyltransferase complex ATPase subunit type 1 TsaE [Candidatus Paceibacterota bacterium]